MILLPSYCDVGMLGAQPRQGAQKSDVCCMLHYTANKEAVDMEKTDGATVVKSTDPNIPNVLSLIETSLFREMYTHFILRQQHRGERWQRHLHNVCCLSYEVPNAWLQSLCFASVSHAEQVKCLHSKDNEK